MPALIKVARDVISDRGEASAQMSQAVATQAFTTLASLLYFNTPRCVLKERSGCTIA